MTEAGDSLSLYDFWKRQMEVFVTLRWKVYSTGSLDSRCTLLEVWKQEKMQTSTLF